MSGDEELIQRGYAKKGTVFGDYEFYNIGQTTIRALRQYKIIPDKAYKDFLNKKPDGILVDRRDPANIAVLVVVESKSVSEFDTPEKRDNAIKQCVEEYCKPLGAKVGVVTDGQQYLWVNPQLPEDNFDHVRREDGYDLEAPFRWATAAEIDQTLEVLEKVLTDISTSNSQLKKEVVQNPANLADRVWQTIWLASGENPDACLATFVEIFTFKYLSDLGVLTQNDTGAAISFYDVLQKDRDKCLKFYFTQVRPHIKKVFPPSLVDQTSVINGMILKPEVHEHNLLFYKILQEFDDFGQLRNIDPEFKSRLYENFLKKSISQKNWGQFFTPRNIVKAIIEMSEIEKLGNGSKVHDPACGVGGFILEPILSKRVNDYFINSGQLTRKLEYTGFDRDIKTVILAKANMLLHLNELLRANPGIPQEFAGVFNETFRSVHNSVLGSLNETPTNEYDLIMTNPPFVTTGTSSMKEFIRNNGLLKQYYVVNAQGVEGLFLEQIVRSLKPGGRAFVIVPDGILNRTVDSKLRSFVLKECFLEAVISLPRNSFYTTPKKTYILALTKKVDKQVDQVDPVYTYLVTNTGETLDSSRFDCANDLPEMVKYYKYFKADKAGFDSPTKKCKVWAFDRFAADTHWSVDRWWSEDEKIELGIVEERNITSIEDFTKALEEERALLDQAVQRLAAGESLTKPEATVEISLGDEQFFDLFIGKRVLRKDLYQGSGTIPVYSANPNSPIGHANDSNISDFSMDSVLWSIDNSNFEFGVIERNNVFRTTDHCGCARIVDADIDPYYVYHYLYWIKSQSAMDRQLRASLFNMKRINIRFPVLLDANGQPKVKPANRPGLNNGQPIYELDIEAQKKISEFYRTFQKVKEEISDRLGRIRSFEMPPLDF